MRSLPAISIGGPNGADEADKGGEIHSNSRSVQVTIKGAGEYSLVDY